MSEDKSVVKPVQAPPLAPLNLKSKLAGTPTSAPKFTVTVKNSAGQNVVVADPRATRALVALMDTYGRAPLTVALPRHWGGPAAFAEINAAIQAVHVLGERPSLA